MAVTSTLESVLAQSPTRLEFNRRGSIEINIDNIVFLEFRRVWGIQLQPGGYSKTHFADYKLTNSLGTSEGQLFFYWKAQEKIEHSGIEFNIAPGINQLELIVYDMNNPEARQSFFFQFSIDGRIYRKGDVEFILADQTGSYSDDFLDRMAQNVLMLQSSVPGLHNTLTFKLQSSRYGISAVRNYLENPFIEVSCGDGQDKRTMESTIVHERAHEFYDNLSNPEKLKAIAEFEDFYFENMRNGRFGQRRFGRRIAGETPIWYDKDTVFGVFMERHYSRHSEYAGHPWDNPTELFASVTAVLAVYGRELLETINGLQTKEERDLAKETVSKVLRIYELYCKTGTKLFEQERFYHKK